MEYSKLISVTGLSGLYELIGSKAEGAIVRSLETNQTRFISNRQHRFSQIETIEIFTTQENNANLKEVFLQIAQSPLPLPDEKNGAELKQYFEQVFPVLDFSKVYTSDMKKIIRWYKQIKEHGIEIPQEEENIVAENNHIPEEESAMKEAENKKEETEENKPTPKTATRKKAAKKTTD